MLKIYFISIFIHFFLCCSNSVSIENRSTPEPLLVQNNILEPDINTTTLIERFGPPDGYFFVRPDSNSFAYYLQHLPLKAHGSLVQYFNGATKENKGVYCAVVDFDIGNRDLQQCADAVMRLRAEYLYRQGAYESIHFNFLSDGKPRYYTHFVKGDYSYPMFSKYLNYIFSYANTRSLYDELKAVEDYTDMKIGDIFIQKGNPYGHAVIVVNMAVDLKTGKKLFMIAQSYMPAQDIQILVNPLEQEVSPWFMLKKGTVETPEWSFLTSDLRRFPE